MQQHYEGNTGLQQHIRRSITKITAEGNHVHCETCLDDLKAQGYIDQSQVINVILAKSPYQRQSSDILQHSQNRPTGDRWLNL